MREPRSTPGIFRRANLRRAPPPSRGHKLRRLVWIAVQNTAFRWSPVPLHAWRRSLLRLFGAKVRSGAHPYPDAVIWAPWNLVMETNSCLGPRVMCYSAGIVHLGESAVVSQGAHLCGATHDHRDPTFPLVIGNIVIGANAWVAADAFIGPGVTVGPGAVVGARSVAVRDVPPGAIVAGNPATVVSKR